MIFDKRYRAYINLSVDSLSTVDYELNGAWVQFYPEITAFKRSLFEDELFSRNDWGEMVIKNMPYEYAFAGGNTTPYTLYDAIKNSDIDNEIRVKILLSTGIIDPDSERTIYGYFGLNDCDFDDDKKIIKVTPSILDQYTDLVENLEKEISIFSVEKKSKATWRLSDTFNADYPSGISISHNVPAKLVASDIDEAKDVSVIGNYYEKPPLISNCKEKYSLNLYMSLVADATASSTNFIRVMFDIFDSGFNLISSNILKEIQPNGLTYIIEELVYNGTLLPGYSAYLYTVFQFSGGTDTINYGNISVNAEFTTVPFVTNDVTINMSSPLLRTIEVWPDAIYGASHGGKINDYNNDVGDLTAYFNADGSPKSTYALGANGGNTYAPYGKRKTIDIITDTGYQTKEIDAQYISDIQGILGEYGYELSELTLYDHLWNRVLAKDVVITMATCKFSRFEQYLPIGEIPDGNWTETTYIQSGKKLWYKKPFDEAYKDDWTRSALDNNDGYLAGVSYRSKITSKVNYPSEDNSVALPSRELRDVIRTVFNQTHQNYATSDVVSGFLWNDTISYIDTSDGLNYISKAQNYLNNIACIHTYSLKTGEQDADDSELLVSFKKLMEDLKKLFGYQIYWWVEPDKTLRIEHLKYIDLSRTVKDVSIGTSEYNRNNLLLSEISSWSYDKAKMFSLIEYNTINSGYKDFAKSKITFDKIVSNKRNQDIKQTYTTEISSTDIRYCIENPADLENGMILATHDNYVVRNGMCPISGVEYENGELAISNLLTNFKYEGVFTIGKINGSSVEFDVTTRTKSGKEFILKGIYLYDFFKNTVGVGIIDSVEFNPDKETTKIKLKYRYNSTSQTDEFILMVSKEGDYELATDIEFNFG